MIRVSVVFLVAAAAAFAQCLPVSRARIVGADLALADVRFQALGATEVIGFAPEPGSKRTFSAAELERIARRHSLNAEGLSEVCFEVPLRKVSEQDIAAALRIELPAGAELRIVEIVKEPLPVGRVVFIRAGLEPAGADGTQIWRGHMQYAESRKAPLWARVQVTQRIEAVVAKNNVAQHAVIPRESLAIETVSLPLSKDAPALRIEDVAGAVARSPIHSGSVVPLSLVEQPPLVKKGDAVKVEVQSGATKLLFEAVAERPGHDGETIEFRNPASGRVFRARLNGSRAVIRL